MCKRKIHLNTKKMFQKKIKYYYF